MEDLELVAMQAVNEALKRLDDEGAVERVLRWAASRYQVKFEERRLGNGQPTARTTGADESDRRSYSNIADFYDAANPSTEAEKVLVAAYWFQEMEGNEDFDSQSLNSELKNLGHGIGNITRELTRLMERKPRLVIQTKKSGSSQQARKKYRVTVEGIRAVNQMLNQAPNSDSKEQ